VKWRNEMRVKAVSVVSIITQSDGEIRAAPEIVYQSNVRNEI
jgi:hypothetical protein